MITHEKFLQLMLEKNPNILILSSYKGDKVPVHCKCTQCGNEWDDSPTHLKLGRGCGNCKRLYKLLLNGIKFILSASTVHSNKYSYSKVDYTKSSMKVTITCPIHGDFEQTPNSHLSGKGCPLCAGNNFKRDKLYFISKAREVHGNSYNYDYVNYTTCKDKVEIKCLKCGNIFLQTPDHHLLGEGCPKCQLVSQRKLYNKLQTSFKEEVILFEVGSTVVPWLEGQRFDMFFPKYNIAVEYNGRLHYVPVEKFGGQLGFEETKRRDSLKRSKCDKNGCSLLEVPYDYSEIDYESLVTTILNIIICHL